MKNVVKWFKGLSPAIQVIIVIVVAFLLFRFYSRAKGYLKEVQNKQENKGAIQGLEEQGMSATYSKAEYDQMANDLEKAMKGLGTDTGKVYNTFKRLRNDIDFIELDNAFGYRGTFWQWPTPDPVSLKVWLESEVKINITEINSILASNGITKRF